MNVANHLGQVGILVDHNGLVSAAKQRPVTAVLTALFRFAQRFFQAVTLAPRAFDDLDQERLEVGGKPRPVDARDQIVPPLVGR